MAVYASQRPSDHLPQKYLRLRPMRQPSHDVTGQSQVEATVVESENPTMPFTLVKPVSPAYRILSMSVKVTDSADVMQAWDRFNPSRGRQPCNMVHSNSTLSYEALVVLDILDRIWKGFPSSSHRRQRSCSTTKPDSAFRLGHTQRDELEQQSGMLKYLGPLPKTCPCSNKHPPLTGLADNQAFSTHTYRLQQE